MIKLSGSSAIYIQIQEYFRAEIASGRLDAGSQIEPIRALALKFSVNPNTIQKALTGLETAGLIYTERTTGKFVTDDQSRINELKKALADDLVDDFIKRAHNIGLAFESVNELIERKWGTLNE